MTKLSRDATLGEWLAWEYDGAPDTVELCWDDPPMRESIFVTRLVVPMAGWTYLVYDHNRKTFEVLRQHELLKKYPGCYEIAEPHERDDW